MAAEAFAEFNSSISAPIQLAKKLHGLVIGWEHRYYGYSQPVQMDETTGSPITGAAGYQYLTVEQALEDVAYFANRFNTTKLDQMTMYRARKGWIRIILMDIRWWLVPWKQSSLGTHDVPEIFYASWSSSAPCSHKKTVPSTSTHLRDRCLRTVQTT